MVVVEGDEEDEDEVEVEAKERARQGGVGVKDRASTVADLLHDIVLSRVKKSGNSRKGTEETIRIDQIAHLLLSLSVALLTSVSLSQSSQGRDRLKMNHPPDPVSSLSLAPSALPDHSPPSFPPHLLYTAARRTG